MSNKVPLYLAPVLMVVSFYLGYQKILDHPFGAVFWPCLKASILLTIIASLTGRWFAADQGFSAEQFDKPDVPETWAIVVAYYLCISPILVILVYPDLDSPSHAPMLEVSAALGACSCFVVYYGMRLQSGAAPNPAKLAGHLCLLVLLVAIFIYVGPLLPKGGGNRYYEY